MTESVAQATGGAGHNAGIAGNTRSVAERLADIPAVRTQLLAAARAARGEAGANPAAMTHSWVFTGAPGSGRSEAAVAFAAALVCTDPAEPGCGRCEACREVFAGAHSDVVRIVPRELSLGVDFVRDRIISVAHRLPTLAPWRVVIVEDADRLSHEAANALLKTVEEPPASTVLVFLAPSVDPEDFPTTLNSRCRHVFVPSRSLEEIARILMAEEGASESDAYLAASASLRHIGRARRLVTTASMQQRRAQVLGLAELISHGDVAFQAATALVKSIDEEVSEAFAEADREELRKLEVALGVGARGRGAQKALRGSTGAVRELEKAQKKRTTRRRRDLLDLSLVDLAGLYRDAYLVAVGSEVAPIHPDFAGLAGELASQVGERGLVDCLSAIARCREHVAVNVQIPVAVDAMIGRLRLAYGVE